VKLSPFEWPPSWLEQQLQLWAPWPAFIDLKRVLEHYLPFDDLAKVGGFLHREGRLAQQPCADAARALGLPVASHGEAAPAVVTADAVVQRMDDLRGLNWAMVTDLGDDLRQLRGRATGAGPGPLGRERVGELRRAVGGMSRVALQGRRTPTVDQDEALWQAAGAVASAEALLVGAGAGMGVDSGLPDFRGDRGFWKAHPPYERLGLNFLALANPRWFARDPHLAWGFYAHRLNLYRATPPHEGFQVLRRWAARMRHGAFAFTSNVDGHFQRAGFDPGRVAEAHGAIDWLQCLRRCGVGLFAVDAAGAHPVAVDEATLRARDPLPACPGCGGLARPNILMFEDRGWDGSRTAAQEDRLQDWLGAVRKDRLVVVECGAGTGVPTVRHYCEGLAAAGAALVRINPREPAAPAGQVSLALGALEALRAIDNLLAARGAASWPCRSPAPRAQSHPPERS
jgi:NAD-dependent SIR2 family protein deacetylase